MTPEVLKQFEERSKSIKSIKGLNKFIKEIMDAPQDYGSICTTMALIGTTAIRVADNKPKGGITGFQAGAVVWEFIRLMDVFGKGPKKITDYSEMLYPQCEYKFEKTIKRSVWDYLQTEASANLENSPQAHPNVLAHWKSISEGIVPFGYTVIED